MAIPEITTFDGYEDKDRKLDEPHSDGGKKYRVGAMKYCIDERCVGRKGYGIDPTDPETAAMQFQKNALCNRRRLFRIGFYSNAPQRPLQHISNAFLLGEGREWKV